MKRKFGNHGFLTQMFLRKIRNPNIFTCHIIKKISSMKFYSSLTKLKIVVGVKVQEKLEEILITQNQSKL